MRMLKMLLATLALMVCIGSMSNAQTSWDLAGDFSSTNPNGAWTYGVYLEDSLKATNGPFFAWPNSFYQHLSGNLYYYGNPGVDLGAGIIVNNPTTADQVDGKQWLRGGEVALHPAYYGWKYAPVIRWTAPKNMTVSIIALFTGRNNNPSDGMTNTDVHILHNGYMNDGPEWQNPILHGTHLFDGIINGNYGCDDLGIAQVGTSPWQDYYGEVSVLAGDTIDFEVGYGPNHYYSYGLTGVSATITEVPEPSTLLLLGIFGISVFVWRKRKAS